MKLLRVGNQTTFLDQDGIGARSAPSPNAGHKQSGLCLEYELNTELNSTCIVRLIGEVRDLSKVGVRRIGDHSCRPRSAGVAGEPRVVEGVCELCPKLYAHRLPDLRILDERQVNVVGRLHSQVREPQRECANVVYKLERGVPVESP